MNQVPPISDALADAIMVIAESLKRMQGATVMRKIVVALVLGSPGTSKLKKKDVEFIVDKIYDLAKTYKAEEILKMKKLLE